MHIQAKVALEKQKHPERFCRAQRCLWRVVKLDHATQTFTARPDCPDGYCPRHRTAITKVSEPKCSALEWIRNGYRFPGKPVPPVPSEPEPAPKPETPPQKPEEAQ